ncbi:hypothetical protein [Catenovulum maritimum]|uniref:hypothetical protein n=1 Tax=Catenovulum maritimum TaxID=1513271 RepID=UPI0006613405|nr:hypothetical protein [Catenovulum maritimum]
MKTHYCSFGVMLQHDSHLVEFCVNEGIELTDNMVDEAAIILSQHFQYPHISLVNKTNSYTYSYSALKVLNKIFSPVATAIYGDCSSASISINTIKSLPWNKGWLVQCFSDKESAISWLIEQQRQFNSQSVKMGT